MSADDLLVVAGEASGDLHGARLLTELRRLVPNLRPFGLGGDEMRAAGFDAVAHSSEIAVVGIAEALRILPRAWRIFRDLLAEVERRGAKAAVLLDSPDFNLRLAKKLHRRGVEVTYYISPQLWAWRKGRIRTVVENVDRMLVLFPFEVDFYRQHGVEVTHVGHPLIDEIPELGSVWDRPRDGDFVLALLPGSRKSEVRSLLPLQLESARRITERLPVTVRLIQAPTVPEELFDELVTSSGVDVKRVRSGRFQAIADSHLAICASGTATVEVGLLGTPLIVVYRLNPLSYRLGRALVDLEHFSMVNLILGRGAVPELIQHDANPARIADLAVALLEDPAKVEGLRAALRELRGRLGQGGASGRAAEAVAAGLEGLREGDAG